MCVANGRTEEELPSYSALKSNQPLPFPPKHICICTEKNNSLANSTHLQILLIYIFCLSVLCVFRPVCALSLVTTKQVFDPHSQTHISQKEYHTHGHINVYILYKCICMYKLLMGNISSHSRNLILCRKPQRD